MTEVSLLLWLCVLPVECGLGFLGQQALCSFRGELGAVQEAEVAEQHAVVIEGKALQGEVDDEEVVCGVLGIAAIEKGYLLLQEIKRLHCWLVHYFSLSL